MPNLEKVSQLVVQLVELTDKGKVEWSETADQKTFQCAFAKYTVTTFEAWSHQDWGQDYYKYGITVRDTNGKVLEEATDADFPAAFESLGEVSPSTVMKGLYETARRSALHVDQALSDLLGSLDQLK